MSAPVFSCEVNFNDPGAAPTWTNMLLNGSPRLMSWQISRGRQKELDRIEGGTIVGRFLNSDRALDPTHTGSIYAPNVLPMRGLRISAVHNGTTYRLGRAFVDSWPQTWEAPTVGSTTVNCSDAFLPLSKVDIGIGDVWPVERAGARITRILDAAGWPAADRAIDTGYSDIQEDTFQLGSGVTALGAIQEASDSDLGIFFVDGSGLATFHDRHHRRGASYLSSQATFTDSLSGGGIPYRSVVLETDADRIWNDIQVVTPLTGASHVQDTTSQTKYLRRTMARSVPLARDTEADDQAAYLLATYKDPRYRLASIQFTPTTDAMWTQALAREIGDHVVVKRWPQGVGSVITQDCAIEAIKHQYDPHGGTAPLQTTWLLSTTAYTAVDWWLLGDATYGVLNTTTKLVY